MPVTIEMGGDRATIDGRLWTSKSQSLEELLNAYVPVVEPHSQHHDADLVIAERIIERLHGQIVHHEPPPPIEIRPGLVY